jgi:hypothetical protein
MEAGKASRSAMGSGLLRAAHVREDPPPWVLEDTLAGQLLDAAGGCGTATCGTGLTCRCPAPP